MTEAGYSGSQMLHGTTGIEQIILQKSEKKRTHIEAEHQHKTLYTTSLFLEQIMSTFCKIAR